MKDTKIKKVRLLQLTILIAITTIPILVFMIYEGKPFSLIPNQISMNYPVIYIDVGYCFSIAGLLILSAFTITATLKILEIKSDNPNRFGKAITFLSLFMLVSALIAFPGRSIEKWRLEQLITVHGYQACPDLTLLFGTPTIDAWVTDFGLCSDPEIQKIAQSGYHLEPTKIAELIAMRNKALTRPQ